MGVEYTNLLYICLSCGREMFTIERIPKGEPTKAWFGLKWADFPCGKCGGTP